MKEIEVKILEVNEAKIRAMLIKHGAKLLMKKNLQKNSIYSSKHTRKNGRIRLRRDSSGNILSFKSPPKFVKGQKINDEYETHIENYQVVVKGLQLLGFHEIGAIETIREDWLFKKCVVSIMTKPQIPTYIEIEGNTQDIIKAARALGYGKHDFFPTNIYEKYGVKTKYLRFKK